MSKRLQKGKGIQVNWCGEIGEIVRSYIRPDVGQREYEIRLGPAYFVYLERKDFSLVDKVIKFDTLVKLRVTL